MTTLSVETKPLLSNEKSIYSGSRGSAASRFVLREMDAAHAERGAARRFTDRIQTEQAS
jgi:hypothetical protein